jgi:hypothetical protein
MHIVCRMVVQFEPVASRQTFKESDRIVEGLSALLVSALRNVGSEVESCRRLHNLADMCKALFDIAMRQMRENRLRKQEVEFAM